MNDGNVELTLKSGEILQVRRPYRLARRYDTPWLEQKETTECNIDLAESLLDMRKARNGRFVVYRWKPGTTTSEYGREISVHEISHWDKIPAPRCEPGCGIEEKDHPQACSLNPVNLVRDLHIRKDAITEALQEWYNSLTAEQLTAFLARHFEEGYHSWSVLLSILERARQK